MKISRIVCSAIIALASLIQMVHAQASGCSKDQNGILQCRLSLTLVDVPDSDIPGIEAALGEFSRLWSIITQGKSVIVNNFPVHSRGDLRIISRAGIVDARTGRPSFIPDGNAFVGSFPQLAHSARVWYQKGLAAEQAKIIGYVMAHEFAHSALGIYDEYRGRGQTAINREREGVISSPWIGDATKPTIMGEGADITTILVNGQFQNYQVTVRERFSYPSDYRDNKNTAQWRTYGASAWESLTDRCLNSANFRFVQRKNYFVGQTYSTALASPPIEAAINLGVSGSPSALGVEASARDTLERVGNGSNVMIAVVLSDSKEASAHRMEMAKIASIQGVEQLFHNSTENRVAVVGFDSVEMMLTALDNSQSLAMVKNAINSISGGDKKANFQLVLDKAGEIFGSDEKNRPRIVFLVSDRVAALPKLAYFQHHRIPIFTIGLGDSDKTVLRQIAEATGGKFEAGNASELPQLFMGALVNSYSLDTDQIVNTVSAEATAGGHPPIETLIGPTDKLRLTLRWPSDANPAPALAVGVASVFADKSSTPTTFFYSGISDDLVPDFPPPPGALDGQSPVISDVEAFPTRAMTYFRGEFQEIYTIDKPSYRAISTWTAMILADTGNGYYEGPFDLEVAVTDAATDGDAVNADMLSGTELIPQSPNKLAIVYPEPIVIKTRIIGGALPVENAEVVAEITMPNASTMNLVLSDQNQEPGFYAGVLGDYSQDGMYSIKVVASNLRGQAMLSSGIEASSRGEYTTPTSAPLFQRILNDQVEVRGTEMKNAPAPSPTNPVSITPNGALYRGAIERAEQVNWHRFSAVKGQRYYIQTSNLLGYGTDMVTQLNLYESDGETLLGSSTRYQGTDASSIEWEAPEDGNYLVSVGLAATGQRGTYGLTVNFTDCLSETVRRRSSSGSSGSSDNKGGSVDGYFLLLILILLMVSLSAPTASLKKLRKG